MTATTLPEGRGSATSATGSTRTSAAAVSRLAVALVGAVGAAYLALYVALALWRLRHPFELEWMEGGMVDHVRRLVEGERIYVAPSLEFASFIYPPAFHYASAAVATITGIGFLPLRLVSFLSSLVVFALLYRFVARETRDRVAALAAVGLFAATYDLGGSFFDVGRVDSMFLAVLLAAFYVLRFADSLPAHVAGGALIALAFLTKQSAAVMAAPVVLYVVLRHPRRGLAAAAVAGTISVGATLLLDVAHDGWYRFYAFDLPSRYHVQPDRLVAFWRTDLLPPLALAWAVGLIHLVAPRAGGPRAFHVAMAAGMIGGAWVSRGNHGGFDNVLIPAFAACALLFGLGVAAARGAMAALPAHLQAGGETWLAGACLLQFALLAYNPRYKLPTAADAEAGRAFVRQVAAVQGDVWIPYHGYMATMAGKRPHAHWMAISDIYDNGGDSLRLALRSQIDSALRTRRFGLVVQSTSPFADTPRFDAFYTAAGQALPERDVLWPVTGSPRRVETLYVPRQP